MVCSAGQADGVAPESPVIVDMSASSEQTDTAKKTFVAVVVYFALSFLSQVGQGVGVIPEFWVDLLT